MIWMLSASSRSRWERVFMGAFAGTLSTMALLDRKKEVGGREILAALDVRRREVLVLGVRRERHLGGLEYGSTAVLLVDHLHAHRPVALVLGIEKLDVLRDQLLEQLAVNGVIQPPDHRELGLADPID